MNSDERRKLGRTGNPDHAKFAKPSPLVDLRGEKTVPACNLGDVRAWFGSFRQNGALLVRAKAPAPLRAVENLNSRIRHRSSHRTNFRTKADLARFALFAEGGLRRAHTDSHMTRQLMMQDIATSRLLKKSEIHGTSQNEKESKPARN